MNQIMTEPVHVFRKPMSKEEMTDVIIAAKKEKGLTWGYIANKLDVGET